MRSPACGLPEARSARRTGSAGWPIPSGKIGGNVALTGIGNSVAQRLGSSDREVAIGMGRGQISNLLRELAGIDISLKR